MGARELIEEMYEHRHQKNFWNMVSLGSRVLWNRGGGVRTVFLYALLHVGGLMDRWGFRRSADWFRRLSTLDRTSRAVGALLQTRFRFVVTEAGGCAIDIDTEEEYDAAQARFEEWASAQASRAKALYGSPALGTGEAPKSVLGDGG